MIAEFITGRYYRYMGNSRRRMWNMDGLMDFVLDHKWRKCRNGYGENADFENNGNEDHRDSHRNWDWCDGIALFEEKLSLSPQLDMFNDDGSIIEENLIQPRKKVNQVTFRAEEVAEEYAF